MAQSNPLAARIFAGTGSMSDAFNCFPGAGGVNRYSPPNWSLTMIRPLSSLHIATQDPCWGLGTEYSNSTLKPAGAEMFRTGVAESETD